MNGQGMLSLPSGNNRYFGGWRNNKYNGEGILIK